MNRPLVSIVTPVLNQARFIERAICSVEEQSYPHIEHIVIDGGSSDGTIDVLRRYPHLSWVSGSDRGQAYAVNNGLQMARGEIVGWLNADDTYLQGAVECVCRYLDLHNDVDMVYGDCIFVDSSGAAIRKVISRSFNLVDLVLSGNYIPQPTVFFRRRVITHVGFLDTHLRHAMDYDLWIRIALAGFRIRYIQKVLANFRLHRGSKTCQEVGLQRREEVKIQKRYIGCVPHIQLKALHELKANGVKSVLIYGTGELAEVIFAASTKRGFEVLGFMDSDRRKWGGRYLGKRIFHPDEAHGLSYDCILISSQYVYEIWEVLKGIGMERGAVVPLVFHKKGVYHIVKVGGQS